MFFEGTKILNLSEKAAGSYKAIAIFFTFTTTNKAPCPIQNS